MSLLFLSEAVLLLFMVAVLLLFSETVPPFMVAVPPFREAALTRAGADRRVPGAVDEDELRGVGDDEAGRES
eukprot:2375370-Rhodomonas_salina.2